MIFTEEKPTQHVSDKSTNSGDIFNALRGSLPHRCTIP